MPHTIAVAGKGGVGKTTTCGMLIDYLVQSRKTPVLVVDADANSNLNEVLGVKAETTLGAIREEMAQAELKGTVPAGMTKADYAAFKFNSALIEEDDYDMLVMGRTQGKGCYCYVNGVLTTLVEKYARNYKYVVMDNEAGLEHVARGTLPKVDTMLLISDCSRRGIQAAGRVAEMIRQLELKPGRMGLIVNRAPGGILSDGIKEEIQNQGFADYYVDHTAGIWPQAASGEPWSATTFQSKGDPITDLFEDMGAEQKARTTYDNLLRLIHDPDVRDPIKFLRQREINHFQRFGEALGQVRRHLDSKNYYRINPAFDKEEK